MISAGLILNLIALAAFIGTTFAIYRQRRVIGAAESSEERARNWRDTAEARLAAITDRDRLIAEMRTEMTRMSEEQGKMVEKIRHLETEMAELKRHDLTAVASLISQLSVDVAARFDRLDTKMEGK